MEKDTSSDRNRTQDLVPSTSKHQQSAPASWVAVARPVTKVKDTAASSVHEPAARPSLSIVIPAYNEEYRLPVVIEALRTGVDPADTEIIIVDDGSEDGTATLARSALDWAPHGRVIELGHNQGKGAAVRAGVVNSTGKTVAFLDADNATSLETVKEMIQLVGPRTGQVGAAFGSRHAQGAVVTGSPMIRGLMGRVFNHVVKFAAGTEIGDTQCGAKVFSAPAARLAFSQSRVDGFAFDVEILRRLIGLGFEVVEHPVDWHHVPGTKVQLLTPLHMLIDIAKLRIKPAPLKFPVREIPFSEELAAEVDLVAGTAKEGQVGWVIDLLDPLRETQRGSCGDQSVATSASCERNFVSTLFDSFPKTLKSWNQLFETKP